MAFKKKVLFTSHTANFQKFNRPFMRMLSEQGWEVHYASAGEEEILDADKAFTVPFERSPLKRGNLKAYFTLKKIIDHEKYDMIHTHTPMGSVVTRLAARAARKQGTRVIYTAHGFHFFKGAPIANWLIYYPIEKYMARHTDILITINNEDFDRARRNFKTRVEYVPGVGVDPSRFKPKISYSQRNELRSSIGIEATDFMMIYPAELNKNKNQNMLIDVMSFLVRDYPHVHLVLAGADSLDGVHAKKIADAGLGSNIHLLGYRSDIAQLLQVSDLSLSASYREGLPVHIIEAMTAGLPVVATRCRGVTELIEDEKNGYLVDFDDVRDMVRRVVSILRDHELAIRMGKSARISASEYSSSKIERYMVDIYKKRPSPDPIRILHVVTIMNRAGIETMLMNYYRNIDRTKVQFDFMVHRNEKGDYDDEIISMGGRIYRTKPMSMGSMPLYPRRFAIFLRDHPEYNVVHSHLDALSSLPLFGAKLARVPIRIAHSHVNNFDRDIRLPIRYALKITIPRYATHFFGCSRDAIQFMFGSKISNFTVMTNAISVSDFLYSSSVRGEVRQSQGWGDSLIIGHVGRFNYPKNHRFLIDTFKEVHDKKPEARLVLIGEGEGRTLIEDKVKLLGLESYVDFLGVRDDIPALLQAMDVFLLPSRYEGLGIVAVEAQASGLPAILSSNIPHEVKILQSTQIAKLSDGPKLWADAVIGLSTKRVNRIYGSGKIRSAGYDIKVASKVMQAFYRGQL